jgi:hypothetical protein
MLSACNASFPTPEPTIAPAPTVEPTPTQEVNLHPVLQCLDLTYRQEPLRQLSSNPCLEGAFTTISLVASPEDIRFQDIPSGFTGLMLLAPTRDCKTASHVHERDYGSSAYARGYRADITQVCGRFGYEHPSIPVECNFNLVLKMTTWSSYFDIQINKPSYVGLIMTVRTPTTPAQELAPIGIPNSGYSGNVRVIRFENCERADLIFTGMIEVIWANAEGTVTIQGLEVLQPNDPLWGNDIVRVIRLS